MSMPIGGSNPGLAHRHSFCSSSVWVPYRDSGDLDIVAGAMGSDPAALNFWLKNKGDGNSLDPGRFSKLDLPGGRKSTLDLQLGDVNGGVPTIWSRSPDSEIAAQSAAQSFGPVSEQMATSMSS